MKQHTVKLFGYTADGKRAGNMDASEVINFKNSTWQFIVWADMELNVFVLTDKGLTKLTPHDVIDNLWTGKTTNGYKMHVTLKKIVGKVIYWM